MVVRRPHVPPRAAAARPVPPVHPDRDRGVRESRAAHRRGAGGAARPLAARPGRSVRDAPQHARRRDLPAEVSRGPAGLPALAGVGAVRGLPEADRDQPHPHPRLQEPEVPGGRRGRAKDGAVPLPALQGPLRGGAGDAAAARGPVRRRSEARPGPRLLHAHHLRGDRHLRPGHAEHARRGRPLRRAGEGAGRTRRPGDRIRGRSGTAGAAARAAGQGERHPPRGVHRAPGRC